MQRTALVVGVLLGAAALVIRPRRGQLAAWASGHRDPAEEIEILVLGAPDRRAPTTHTPAADEPDRPRCDCRARPAAPRPPPSRAARDAVHDPALAPTARRRRWTSPPPRPPSAGLRPRRARRAGRASRVGHAGVRADARRCGVVLLRRPAVRPQDPPKSAVSSNMTHQDNVAVQSALSRDQSVSSAMRRARNTAETVAAPVVPPHARGSRACGEASSSYCAVAGAGLRAVSRSTMPFLYRCWRSRVNPVSTTIGRGRRVW